ncbi:hypothetical protein [Falsiroseomonas sp. E2-1-a20]|uniref:hypothetical protein n=1 Tax=Falsiroseomonas sp. E2-1-a20 TaxID=3239300 RepID=UPI003F2D5A61
MPISRRTLARRFELVFNACRYAARLLSDHQCQIEAVYEAHERVGYEFAFPTEMMAVRFRLYYESVLRGRPFPLKLWR